MAYASSIRNNLDSLAEMFIFSLIVSQALLISTSVSKFSKAQTRLRFQHDTALYHLPSLIY
jgi:hypothetical protein